MIPSAPRLRALVTPREHGAWGLLFIPLLTGAAVGVLRGGVLVPIVLLGLAAFVIFWARTPVESLLGNGPIRAHTAIERNYVWKAVLVGAGCGALLIVLLLWRTRNVSFIWLGAASALTFALQAFLRKISRRTRMLSQIVGALGLTITAPAAYLAAVGKLDRAALGVWITNWLFAGDQIHFVQLRIHAGRAPGFPARIKAGGTFLAGNALLILMLAVAVRKDLIPLAATVAFVPIVMRGLLWFFQKPRPLAVREIGWTEVIHSVVFGILLVAAFGFTG